jgi:glutamine amidotransferase
VSARSSGSRPPVALVDYGVGNLHSAAKALDRAGGGVRVVRRIDDAGGAAGLVVPGVGAYGACLAGLDRAGGVEAVRDWLASGRPLLGVCVGMQLLFEASEEGPVDGGVGALPGTVARLGGDGAPAAPASRPGPEPRGGARPAAPASRRSSGAPGGTRRAVKVPHIGWDEVAVRPGSRLLAGLPAGTRFYFVHSYAPPAGPGYTAATCEYGGEWAAAVEAGGLFGTQFHPEKSGAAGLALLANFVGACREGPG